MKIKTAELYDEFADQLQLVDPVFNNYGDEPIFSGEIHTLKLYEDNLLIQKKLDYLGKGRVLVIDGGGSLRSALIDEELVALAIRNGWEGIIVNGCIRDSEEINMLEIGIKALNTCPITSKQLGHGEKNIALQFAGVTFQPGQYLYADGDGMFISSKRLI